MDGRHAIDDDDSDDWKNDYTFGAYAEEDLEQDFEFDENDQMHDGIDRKQKSKFNVESDDTVQFVCVPSNSGEQQNTDNYNWEFPFAERMLEMMDDNDTSNDIIKKPPQPVPVGKVKDLLAQLKPPGLTDNLSALKNIMGISGEPQDQASKENVPQTPTTTIESTPPVPPSSVQQPSSPLKANGIVGGMMNMSLLPQPQVPQPPNMLPMMMPMRPPDQRFSNMNQMRFQQPHMMPNQGPAANSQLRPNMMMQMPFNPHHQPTPDQQQQMFQQQAMREAMWRQYQMGSMNQQGFNGRMPPQMMMPPHMQNFMPPLQQQPPRGPAGPPTHPPQPQTNEQSPQQSSNDGEGQQATPSVPTSERLHTLQNVDEIMDETRTAMFHPQHLAALKKRRDEARSASATISAPSSERGPHRSAQDSVYTNMMSRGERAKIIRIQMLQLLIEDPVEDDFYYVLYSSKYFDEPTPGSTGGQQRSRRVGPTSREVRHRGFRLPVVFKEDAKPYEPIQFEGALGKVMTGTVRAPRLLIDYTSASSNASSSDTKLESAQQANKSIPIQGRKATSLQLENLLGNLLQLDVLLSKLTHYRKSLYPLRPGDRAIQYFNKLIVKTETKAASLAIESNKIFFANVDSPSEKDPHFGDMPTIPRVKYEAFIEHNKGRLAVVRLLQTFDGDLLYKVLKFVAGNLGRLLAADRETKTLCEEHVSLSVVDAVRSGQLPPRQVFDVLILLTRSIVTMDEAEKPEDSWISHGLANGFVTTIAEVALLMLNCPVKCFRDGSATNEDGCDALTDVQLLQLSPRAPQSVRKTLQQLIKHAFDECYRVSTLSQDDAPLRHVPHMMKRFFAIPRVHQFAVPALELTDLTRTFLDKLSLPSTSLHSTPADGGRTRLRSTDSLSTNA